MNWKGRTCAKVREGGSKQRLELKGKKDNRESVCRASREEKMEK